MLFTEEMLEDPSRYVAATMDNLASAAKASSSNRQSYAQQALECLREAVTAAVRDWPNPTPTAKEAQQGESIVDALLTAQLKALTSFDVAVQEKRAEFEALDEAIADLRTKLQTVNEEVDDSVARAIAAVDAQKTRVDSVVDVGNKATANIPSQVTRKFNEWAKATEDRFESRFAPLAARTEAATTSAEEAMERIAETEAKYQTLVDLDTAERLAGHYDREARALRISAIVAYGVGVLAIVAAAFPLAITIAEQVHTASLPAEPTAAGAFNWGALATRALFAILLGGVATVAVRVAGRLLTQASACKRFAMEMRTFEPFLSGAEAGEVNKARLELVSQAFGKAYVGPVAINAAPSTEKEDAVNVGVLERVVELISKVAARGA